MSAEALRRAAALMRERAEAASPGPWHVCESPEWHENDLPDQVICADEHVPVASLADEWYEDEDGEPASADDARHIASWHPAVALAVADWLEHAAKFATWRTHVGDGPTADLIDEATKVARAYLGEQP